VKNNIFLALLEKQAIGSDNIITASYVVKDLFGRTFSKINEFKIEHITRNNESLTFHLHSLKDDKNVQVGPESIQYIDGMDVPRYADIYDLLPDGSTKKVGKKRGRKPKNHSLL
jgi:hypothetical protein